MAFPKAISMPTAIEGRSTQDLSCTHITTCDWLQFNVSKYIKMVPKQSIDVRHIPFQRLQPMPVPTFGHGRFVHRAYFVPFRTVWTAWDDFYNGVPHSYDNGEYYIPSIAPSMYNADLVKMFLTEDFSTLVNSGDAFDFQLQSIVDDGTANPEDRRNYVFTPLGRFAYKLLRSLGYSVTFINTDDAPTQQRYVDLKDAMKLLCVAKVYCDHYFPQQYANTDDAIWLNSYFINNDDLWTDPGAGSLDSVALARLFRCLYRLPYGSDYFTSAWDNPVSPNDGLIPSTEIVDESVIARDYRGATSNVISNGMSPYTPRISENDGPDDYALGITKYALTALNKMTDYVKRMQLVGSRVIDRFFARFGIKLSNEALKRSVKIAEYYENIAFADVTSMASTDTATLGDYAGKGVSGRNEPGAFQFTATEHGMLVIISINVPQISYYQGEHRDSHHLTRLDYWNPEFDSLGVQALALSELYTPIDGKEITDTYLSKPNNFADNIFGFTPRYAEYKIPYDQITGDYNLRSKGVGVDSWYLARDVSHFIDGCLDTSHNLDFVMSDDKEQYNRIFNNVSNSADHFNVVHYFQIKSSFPGKSLFDTYEFENEDQAEKVVVNINGSTESN